MCLTFLGMQTVICCCGYGNQAWYSQIQYAQNANNICTWTCPSRTSLWNGAHCCFFVEISRIRGHPVYDRVCMEYTDNNAYDILECPDSAYSMWDCCFPQLFSYGKQEDDDKFFFKRRGPLLRCNTGHCSTRYGGAPNRISQI